MADIAETYLPQAFYADVQEIDPLIAKLIHLENEQQLRKLILVASVSSAPTAVLQSLGSSLQNVCAEGYARTKLRHQDESLLQEITPHLTAYRRYANRRYYKGTNYIDLIETLAERRCAELFASDEIAPEEIFVNIQPLSGAPANLAVYQTLLKQNDTIMGMNLFGGGHLTHGSTVNISGQWYNAVSYTVDPDTQKLDYEIIRQLAQQYRPRLIIAGFTSYPWAPDWLAFRKIADEVGAYLLADIAHTAGLIAGGVHPNPVGIAHVTTLTANKTLCGPRGAAILTTNQQLAKRIQQAVFPGIQGAPHPNKFAAMAVTFHLAQTKGFRQLQQGIVDNAQALAMALQHLGIPLAYGGTDTHLLVIDLKELASESEFVLWGEPVARIFELAGLVVNKNSLPGDLKTSLATGIRLGTTWVTQRGLDQADMQALAHVIHQLITQIKPFAYTTTRGSIPRGKIDLENLLEARVAVQKLVSKTVNAPNGSTPSYESRLGQYWPQGVIALRLTGKRIQQFVQQISTVNIASLLEGETAVSYFLNRQGHILDQVLVIRETNIDATQLCYLLIPTPDNIKKVVAWVQGLSDGYIVFDEDDLFRKVEGPAIIDLLTEQDITYARQSYQKKMHKYKQWILLLFMRHIQTVLI